MHAMKLLLATTLSALAVHAHPLVSHHGSQGQFYSGAVATRDLIFVSGANPSVNGTLPDGIEAQTAAAIRNIAAILEEAGTSWDNVVKTTVFLANWDDYASMNDVYGQMIPDPKPARSSAFSSKLPGNFLIEMDAIAAIPRNRC